MSSRSIIRLRYLLLLGTFLFVFCNREVAHSFSAHWLALPAELQGEMQGMPAHWPVVGKGGAVSTANALATDAGIQVLRMGGNAIDALLAVQWVLAVVEPQSSGLGGGGFLLYYEAKSRKIYALDGREESPANIDENLFLDANGKPLPFPERIRGARAVGVPGTVALMAYAKRRFGSANFGFAATFARAIELAQNGIRVSPRLHQAMRLNRDRLIRQNGKQNSYLRSGEPYGIAEIFYQRDLAATLQLLSEKGGAVFYNGEMARDIVTTVTKSRDYASAMTLNDLASYRIAERKAAEISTGKFKIFSIGAPASGAYALSAIKAAAGRGTTDDAALIVASLAGQKAAFAVREKILEDPDFAAAKSGNAAGTEAHNTTHVSIADAEGNIVSYTSSIETSMGSALIVKGRGFLLNNQLSDFSAEKGKVNSVEKGRRPRNTVLNSDARETQGAKRPKSSMSPLIILKHDGSFISLGSPGGPTIVGTNALVASRVLAGDELQEAINKPRALMMPNAKALVELPLRRDQKMLAFFRQKGIDVDLRRNIISLGSVQAIGFDARTGLFTAASDLRREGLGLVVNPTLD